MSWCLGFGALSGMDTGVKANSPSATSGCPITWNGQGVPRPTLISVASNKHKEGYNRIACSLGKFGLGGTGNT